MTWTEFSFIDSIKAKMDSSLIGDDCSVEPLDEEYSQLVSTDLMVEGIHFLKDLISPMDLGKKIVEINISDIAAMGGSPERVYLSIAIPKDIDFDYLDQLMNGVLDSCNSYGVQLAGGDTTKSLRDIFLNIAVLGKVKNQHLKLRSTAQVGDLICVDSYLGDSAAGLEIILNPEKYKNLNKENIQKLKEAHLRPKAHLKEGRFLSQYSGVHSLMDISDGIGGDLKRISQASQVQCILEASKIPLSSALQSLIENLPKSLLEYAINGGEDYGLLFTCDSLQFKTIERDFFQTFGRKLFIIGEVTLGPGRVSLKGDPKTQLNGFDHFS